MHRRRVEGPGRWYTLNALRKKPLKMRHMGPPHRKQLALLQELFEPDPDHVKQIDLVCGRGFGKSLVAIDIACRALSLGPFMVGLFLEPDWNRVNRVFLKKWKIHVPPHLYELNKGERCITWINGALLFYGPRNVTGSYSHAEDAQVGQDTSFIIDDEAALRCSYPMYGNNMATIRVASPVRFYLTVSTPRVGPYKRLVTGKGHRMFRGKSADNPYLPKNYVEQLRANMSAEQARRELEGEFISLEGRIWKTAKYQEPDPDDKNDETFGWPNGNRHDAFVSFDPKRPWWLFCDLGGRTGAYVVVQKTEPEYRGRKLFAGSVWVAVADLCPTIDASASRAFQMLRKHFGTPTTVVAGKDIKTHDGVIGKTVAYFAQQVWGSVNIIPVDESVYSKQIQYDRLSYLMESAEGHRRFTVARKFVSLDQESKRGVREMINEDEWPPEEQRRPSDFLPKNKDNIVQHTRDALLMGTVAVMSTPDWTYDLDPPA